MTVLGVDSRRLGLWFTKAEIVFALVHEDGTMVLRGRVPRNVRGRTALLDSLPPNLEIVILAHVRDAVIAHARGFGIPCWYVRIELFRALRVAAGITNAPLELNAALLARLPGLTDPAIRCQLCCNLPLFPRLTTPDQSGNSS